MNPRLNIADFNATIAAGRDGMPISIDEAQELTGIARPGVLKRFRQLQDEGKGLLKLGRHGKPTRFYFAVDDGGRRLESIVQAQPQADQETGPPEPSGDPVAAALHPQVVPTGSSPEKTMAGAEDQGGNGGMIEHRYQLRQSLIIRLALPSDLTEREASRFARFVESLPF